MSDVNPIAKSRRVLLFIAGIPVIVILAATCLWYFVVHGDLDLVGLLGTANRGALVQPPRPLDDLVLRDEAGISVKYSELEPRWTMVIPAAGGHCDETCERNLYVTRQVHVAMGKEFNRLRRLYISEESAANTKLTVRQLSDGHAVPATADFIHYLAVEHSDLKPLTLGAGGYAKLFPEHAADPSTWYLVDPAGWVMMSYNKEIPYKDVMADLKFLLKNSGG
jgi:hypothetical protein